MNEKQRSARERIIRRVLAGLTIAIGAAGVGWGTWQSLRSRPSLDEVIALAAAGKLDEAETKVRDRLATDPRDGAANLLLAQIILNRPEPASSPAERRPSPSGQVALDHLDRIRNRTPSMVVPFHVCRGNALNRLLRFDEAEADWLEALRADPAAPEAGWNLLTMYYVQGRQEEGRRLALRLYRVEPDPHDRVSLLMELLRPDTRPPAPGSVITLLEPVVRHGPKELHSAITLGLSLIRDNKLDEGIDRLRRVVRIHPDRVESWDGLLTGLDESGRLDDMQEELKRLPTSLSDSPRLLKHRARIAQEGNRWKEALELYREARRAEPDDRVLEYRLGRALRHAGEIAEADEIERRVRSRDVAIQELRPLYDRAIATPDLGIRPHPELYQRIADLRERMSLTQEAIAWHRLVLGNDPNNELSLAALARLGSGGGSS